MEAYAPSPDHRRKALRENQEVLQELLLRTSYVSPITSIRGSRTRAYCTKAEMMLNWTPTAQGCTITSSSSTSDRNPTNQSSNFFRIA
ncbi:hypothetical protein BDQ17DRAFT_1375030 [Cyathus striatus]|nr:hypothetical protein BDQ17DRAFT_1375030 [Cyathus striatus]